LNRGAVDTPMVRNLPAEIQAGLEGVRRAIPMRRSADAEEVAKLAAWLLSEESSYTTGAVHIIDGGLTA
jgi:NAD(P)-dependent dehydrogenase (short-subunit alcohol dehydrogenase family)